MLISTLYQITYSCRTRKNAHLTDDKEIEQKLALGEHIRKGEKGITILQASNGDVHIAGH